MTGRHRMARKKWLPVNWVFEAFVVGVISCTVGIVMLNVLGGGLL